MHKYKKKWETAIIVKAVNSDMGESLRSFDVNQPPQETMYLQIYLNAFCLTTKSILDFF